MSIIKLVSPKLAGLVVLSAFTMAASAVPLTDLLQGGSLQQGDKIFTSFSWSGNISAEGIDILGIGNGVEGPASPSSGLYGIQISGGGLSGLTAGSVGSVVLNYAVETAPGYGMLISDIHQRITADGSGNLLLQATEWAYDQNGNQVAISNVGNLDGRDPIDPPAELNDILNLADPLQKIWIQKEIYWNVLRTADSSISIRVKQQFSQVAVPDGGTTVLLLGLGLSGLGLFARKLTA